MEKYLKVGVITSTHGLKGEFKIYPTTDDAKRFKKLSKVYLGEDYMPRKITGVRFFKQFVIAKFEGFDTVEDAEAVKGKNLYVERADAVPLGENEYYIADLIGMQVVENGIVLGQIKDVLETGANDVYIVDSADYGEFMIPAIRQCIRQVDVEQGIMQVELLPGLLPDKKDLQKGES